MNNQTGHKFDIGDARCPLCPWTRNCLSLGPHEGMGSCETRSQQTVAHRDHNFVNKVLLGHHCTHSFIQTHVVYGGLCTTTAALRG